MNYSAKSIKNISQAANMYFNTTLTIIMKDLQENIIRAAVSGSHSIDFIVPVSVPARNEYSRDVMGKEMANNLKKMGFAVKGDTYRFSISWV